MPFNIGPHVTTTKITMPMLTRLQSVATMPSLRPIQTPALFFNAPNLSPGLMSGLLELSTSNRVPLPFRAPRSLKKWSEHFCDLFLGSETTWSSLLRHSKSFQAVVNDPDCQDNIVLEEVVYVFKDLLLARPLEPMACPLAFSNCAQKR